MYFVLFIVIAENLKFKLLRLPYKFIKQLYKFIDKNEKFVYDKLILSLKILGENKNNNLKL
jgi:hypothetical protein